MPDEQVTCPELQPSIDLSSTPFANCGSDHVVDQLNPLIDVDLEYPATITFHNNGIVCRNWQEGKLWSRSLGIPSGESEAIFLKAADKFASKTEDENILGHVPRMYLYQEFDFDSTSDDPRGKCSITACFVVMDCYLPMTQLYTASDLTQVILDIVQLWLFTRRYSTT